MVAPLVAGFALLAAFLRLNADWIFGEDTEEKKGKKGRKGSSHSSGSEIFVSNLKR